SSGTVSVCGFDVSEKSLESRAKVGYLPENAPIYSDMSVFSFLAFCAEMRGLFGENKKRAINRAVELCFLDSVLRQSVDTLSKGYRHRTCLAQAIIHDPEVLILDEPTDGLDPNQKHEVRSLIRKMGTDKAIIFSTHILEEVEAACTRAIIIDQGKIVANGTPAELKAKAPFAGSIVLGVRNASWNSIERELLNLSALGGLELLEQKDSYFMARLQPAGNLMPELISLVSLRSWQVETLRIEEGRLDDVFRAVTMPDTVPHS
ncbi:MAG: ATP-binding cassette domain-containing protein, partial [Verrucomicrobia bacterium]|nr:ATP-binding cassette domain-containing protein [Verrucomicrobiota bacterium]